MSIDTSGWSDEAKAQWDKACKNFEKLVKDGQIIFQSPIRQFNPAFTKLSDGRTVLRGSQEAAEDILK